MTVMGVTGRRVTAIGRACVVVALAAAFVGCEAQMTPDVQPTASARPRTIVADDFESGTLTDWRSVGGGSGGWFIYTDGAEAPDPALSDPNVPFVLPDPPQGTYAAVTDMNGPGTRILYRDLRLDGRLTLAMTVFYVGAGRSPAPRRWRSTPSSQTSNSGSI